MWARARLCKKDPQLCCVLWISKHSLRSRDTSPAKIKMHSNMHTALGEKPLSHASERNITALSAEQEVSKLNLYTVFKEGKSWCLCLFTSMRSTVGKKKKACGSLRTNPITSARRLLSSHRLSVVQLKITLQACLFCSESSSYTVGVCWGHPQEVTSLSKD